MTITDCLAHTRLILHHIACLQAWDKGLTLGTPIWPDLLECLLSVRSSDSPGIPLDQRVRQVVLSHQQELLSVLGGELAPPGHQLSRERLLGTDAEGYAPEADDQDSEPDNSQGPWWMDDDVGAWGPTHVRAPQLWTAATAMRKRLWCVIKLLAQQLPAQG